MKRFGALFAVAAMVAAIPASHSLLAHQGPTEEGKWLLCHITRQTTRDDGTPVFRGHLIEVSKRAVKAHCRHGDHDGYQTATPPPRRTPPQRDVGDRCGRAVGAQAVHCGFGKSRSSVVDPPWFNGGRGRN